MIIMTKKCMTVQQFAQIVRGWLIVLTIWTIILTIVTITQQIQLNNLIEQKLNKQIVIEELMPIEDMEY